MTTEIPKCDRCGADIGVLKTIEHLQMTFVDRFYGSMTAKLRRHDPPPPGREPNINDDTSASVQFCPSCADVFWDVMMGSATWKIETGAMNRKKWGKFLPEEPTQETEGT